MNSELHLLVWSVALGLVQIALVATCTLLQHGLRWTVSARDDAANPLTGVVAARLDRACANFLETFPLFAAAVLAAHWMAPGSALTVLGAQLYFWARLAYVPAYAAGIPWLRSVIWGVSLAGILVLLAAAL